MGLLARRMLQQVTKGDGSQIFPTLQLAIFFAHDYVMNINQYQKTINHIIKVCQNVF
jgi:hypothetical protein